jgi:hypothetical protein
MTARERGDLCQIVRQRERLAKTAAAQRSAQLRADFEKQLQTSYSWDCDEVWSEMHKLAQEATRQARQRVIERGRELGIHDRFSPRIHVSWYSAGEQASNERRIELRRLAAKQIDAVEKKARVRIEEISVEAQTEIMAAGITSDEGRAFLERLPPIDSLMPPVEIGRVEAMLETEKKREAWIDDDD